MGPLLCGLKLRAWASSGCPGSGRAGQGHPATPLGGTASGLRGRGRLSRSARGCLPGRLRSACSRGTPGRRRGRGPRCTAPGGCTSGRGARRGPAPGRAGAGAGPASCRGGPGRGRTPGRRPAGGPAWAGRRRGAPGDRGVELLLNVGQALLQRLELRCDGAIQRRGGGSRARGPPCGGPPGRGATCCGPRGGSPGRRPSRGSSGRARGGTPGASSPGRSGHRFGSSWFFFGAFGERLEGRIDRRLSTPVVVVTWAGACETAVCTIESN